MREAAFSLIAAWFGTAGEPGERMLAGYSFADFFAGSGAIALEAASRGAAPVLAVESDRRTAEIVKGNQRALRLELGVRAAKAESVVAGTPAQPFDVLWFDPPYALASTELDVLVAVAVANAWLAAGGLVVLERSSRSEPPSWPPSLTAMPPRRYGETTLHLATLEAS